MVPEPGMRHRAQERSSWPLKTFIPSVTWNKTLPFSTFGEKGVHSVFTFKAHTLLYGD